MSIDHEKAVAAGHAWLDARGFNLQAVLDCASFPDALAQAWHDCGIIAAPEERLVLLGMAGPGLWQWIRSQNRTGDELFDFASEEATAQVCEQFWGAAQPRLLYPGSIPIPLQQLGRWAGWASPSPLGLDISPLYGPWFAYRAAFLVDAPLAFTKIHPGGTLTPCAGCASQPCVRACPAGAVHASRPFKVKPCLTQRLADTAGCGVSCASRLACPVGAAWRYSDEQLHYHGQRSLASLARWAQSQTD